MLLFFFCFLQTYEWLSSCRDRLSVSNLERISEESVKEEKNAPTFECVQIDRKLTDFNMATRYRRQVRRPMSVSGYPALEESRRSTGFSHDFKSTQQRERTSQSENEKPVQTERFTTMRRASFQCHAVLTKQKGKMPTLSASHEYPSPMHAVMRQYQPKIGDDKEKKDKNESACSSRTPSRQSESLEGATGVTVIRRSSFTARSSSKISDMNFVTSSQTRRTSCQNSSLFKSSNDTLSHDSSAGEVDQAVVTSPISSLESLQRKNQESGVLRRVPLNQNCIEKLEPRQTESSQTAGRASSSTDLRDVSKHYQYQSQMHMSKELLPSQSNSAKYSEYQNLKDLEQGKICKKTESVHSDNQKHPDNQSVSPTELSVSEKSKNFQNLKGDTCSYTSDEGYCASLSSIPSGRRQLSIQSDTSWISADIEDCRSCDANVVSYSCGCASDTAHCGHSQKLDRKSSLNKSKNSITTRNEILQTSKVLPFRQTSL